MDMVSMETGEISAQASGSGKKHARRRLLLATAVATALAAGGWWTWSTFFASNTVATENAYTAAEIADVTSLVAGPVARVLAHDTQSVKTGDVLVVLDDADARLAVEQAEAALARTERSVRQMFANDRVLKERVGGRAADLTAAEADLARANADFDKAEFDVGRQRALARTGTASQEKLSNAEAALAVARAMVDQANARIIAARSNHAAAAEELKANAVLIDGVTVADHPDVLAARARLEQARLDLSRTTVRAPIDGVVSQRGVEIGQRVQPGQRLMTVAPVGRIYVNANFKEAQLRDMMLGQRVHLVSDLYGDGVVYEGRVVGLAAGSGSAFAAIPAQNATGNWIKVVQRVPVRISLDEAHLRAHPLRVGLSMHATVDLDHPPAENETGRVEK